MSISNIIIRKTFKEGNLKAIVSVTIDDCLAVHDIKIIEANGKTFVAMPNRKDENGVYRDITHPIHSDFRNKLETKILRAYENQLFYEKLLKDCLSV